MAELLQPQPNTSSPFDAQVTRPNVVSLEEAQRDATEIFNGRMKTRTLFGILAAVLVLFVMGYTAYHAPANVAATNSKATGAVLLGICVVGLAYAIYEYRRKQRVFVLEDSFAIERRFSSEVELVPWATVAKLYCLDRTTEVRHSIYFIPIATSKDHKGKLRIVLHDGRQIVITNRVRDFTAMATQFILRTKAAQLAPSAHFLMEGGTLDFDKLGLTSEGLVLRGKLLPWDDVQQITLDGRGALLFRSPKLWRSPRFKTDTLPNASLLLELLSMFGRDVYAA